MQATAEAITQCKFEATDPAADEVVLYKILQVGCYSVRLPMSVSSHEWSPCMEAPRMYCLSDNTCICCQTCEGPYWVQYVGDWCRCQTQKFSIFSRGFSEAVTWQFVSRAHRCSWHV